MFGLPAGIMCRMRTLGDSHTSLYHMVKQPSNEIKNSRFLNSMISRSSVDQANLNYKYSAP